MKIPRTSYTPLLIGLVACLVGCIEENPCDPGYIHVAGACVPLPPDAAPKTDAQSFTDAATAAMSKFGDSCAVSDDCKGSINYCVNDFSNPLYCTKRCDPAAPECPTGWTCFNAEQFIPGAGQICAQPRKM